MNKAIYHLPGLFEFYELYKAILPLYKNHREYFYDWCEIGSIYGAPAGFIWGGGRVGFGEDNRFDVLDLLNEFDVSGRLTFSNSLIREEHLSDKLCNELCSLFAKEGDKRHGVIVYSDLLLDYIRENYPELYFVSSTTKVLTDFEDFRKELNREEFSYVVPDFRLNKEFQKLNSLPSELKDRVEFLSNECCYINCQDRKECYKNVSLKSLGEDCPEHVCKAPYGSSGYRFSRAMRNHSFIGIDDIKNTYLPMGFSNFKIEGRGLGSALILEFILYYMVKVEYQLIVREEIYLDSMLDLF